MLARQPQRSQRTGTFARCPAPGGPSGMGPRGSDLPGALTGHMATRGPERQQETRKPAPGITHGASCCAILGDPGGSRYICGLAGNFAWDRRAAIGSTGTMIPPSGPVSRVTSRR